MQMPRVQLLESGKVVGRWKHLEWIGELLGTEATNAFSMSSLPIAAKQIHPLVRVMMKGVGILKGEESQDVWRAPSGEGN